MKLHEYQAKEIFARYGIPIPRGLLANTPEEARDATQSMGGRAVIKAQVHAGGRGKAGGIKVAQTPEAARQTAQDMLGQNLVTNQTAPEGVPINSVLVEELADIKQELYAAITIDRGFRGPVMIVCAAGGMDIEEVADTRPEDIHTEPIDPGLGLMPFQARRLAERLGIEGASARPAAQILTSLYRIFTDHDCSLVEINPLIITGGGGVVALDAKMDLEDDAMFRHQDLLSLRDRTQEDQLEAEAADQDIAYVNLDGDVGCLVNGAGLAMATLDVTNAAGAAPANFLDVGGGATDEKVAQAVEVILSDPKVRRVLVNVFGGILRCDVAARGIVLAYQRRSSQLPLIVRMLGTNLEEGKSILAESGLNVTFADTLTEAAEAIKRAGGRNSTQLPDSPIWFVRAEFGNALADYFLENGIVEMGWGIGPLGPDDSIDEIAGRLRAYNPYQRPGTLSKWAREIREFNQDMEVGDAVATYEPRSRTYHIGIIRSLLVPAELGPHYDEWGNDYVHQVEWLYQVARDTLSQSYARRNLDRRSTLHRLSQDASVELRHLCSE